MARSEPPVAWSESCVLDAPKPVAPPLPSKEAGMALVPLVLRLAAGLGAAWILLLGQTAWAGRVHPDLESQLSALPPGGTISVIVEMWKQGNPAASVAPLRLGHR